MGAVMLTAAIAVPATRTEPIDYAAGHESLKTIQDPDLYRFTEDDDLMDVLTQILETMHSTDEATIEAEEKLLDDLETEGGDHIPSLRMIGDTIIDDLARALADATETDRLRVGDYDLYLSAGPSWGDDPTLAAIAIWNAHKLPEDVLIAMGFVPDHGKPLARKNSSQGPVTDTDVIDAIALGLGTQAEWNGGDCLTWIADQIGAVRRHPGNIEPPQAYLGLFREDFDFDPLSDNYLIQFVADDAVTGSDEDGS